MTAPVEAKADTAKFSSGLSSLLADLELATGPLGVIGTIALEAARQGAPMRSGRARASHSAAPQRKKVRITVDTPYAAAVHWGWPAHGIKRQPWVVATFARSEAEWKATATDKLQSDIDKAAAKT